LALVLILIGGVTTVRGLLSRSTPLGPFAGKALLLVTVAVALFGFAVEGAGLAVATILLVVVSSAAGSSLKLPAAMALALALAAFCVVVFRLALGLPFPIVGPWLGGLGGMHEVFANLAIGGATALSAANLLYCFLGVLLGTLVGVLPGLGPVATIAMLLPATLSLPAESALIMLAGIYYGAQYGGSTTAILINLPGESSSVVTTLDGHRMAQQGRAGVALSTAAIGSFVAGTVATFVIAFLAPP